jgi:hypothetical protein
MLKNIWGELQKNSKSVLLFTLAGLFLFGLSGFMWWQKVYLGPERTFWAMLDSSLNTPSITRQVVQSGPETSLTQTTRLNFGNQANIHAITILRQASPDGDTAVTTETIESKDKSFVRYISVLTPEKKFDGSPLDLSSIENVWTKQPSQPLSASHPFIKEVFFGGVLFGNLQPHDRRELLAFAKEKNIYQIDFNDVTSEKSGLSKVYVYKTKIDPEKYVTLVREYAKRAGLQDLEGLDPALYQGSQPFELEIRVRASTRQLQEINFTLEGRKELYAGHGVIDTFTFPENALEPEELQRRLENIR